MPVTLTGSVGSTASPSSPLSASIGTRRSSSGRPWRSASVSATATQIVPSIAASSMPPTPVSIVSSYGVSWKSETELATSFVCGSIR